LSIARSALAESAIGMTIFVDRFRASDWAVVWSELDFGDCLREVLRGEVSAARAHSEPFSGSKPVWGPMRVTKFRVIERSHLNEQNSAELFEASKGKTRRQIEQLLAARFPRPDVREQIRRLPARAEVRGGIALPLTAARAIDALPVARRGERIAAVSPLAAEPDVTAEPDARVAPLQMPEIAASSTPRPGCTVAHSRLRGRELEPLSADRFGVRFTADAELRELIERARALASHRIPNGDLASLMKLMVRSFVEQAEKRRFGIGSRPRRPQTESRIARHAESAASPGGVSVPPGAHDASIHPAGTKPPRKRGRYLAAQVRRETHARDGGQCAFVSPDGRRCSARAFLQFDHITPFARCGTGDARNMRLLCQAHNLWHARKCFGATHVAAKIAARNLSGNRVEVPVQVESGASVESRGQVEPEPKSSPEPESVAQAKSLAQAEPGATIGALEGEFEVESRSRDRVAEANPSWEAS